MFLEFTLVLIIRELFRSVSDETTTYRAVRQSRDNIVTTARDQRRRRSRDRSANDIIRPAQRWVSQQRARRKLGSLPQEEAYSFCETHFGKRKGR